MPNRPSNELAQSRLKKQDKNLHSTQSTKRAAIVFKNDCTYKSKIPTLVIGLFFGVILSLLVTQIYPSYVANVLFDNSFLPIILLVFLTSFFLSSYAFLHSTKGFLFASWASLLTWALLANAIPAWITVPVYTLWFASLVWITQKLST